MSAWHGWQGGGLCRRATVINALTTAMLHAQHLRFVGGPRETFSVMTLCIQKKLSLPLRAFGTKTVFMSLGEIICLKKIIGLRKGFCQCECGRR